MSALLKDVSSHAEWVATSVYGPSKASDKADFCVELSQVGGMWYVECGIVLGCLEEISILFVFQMKKEWVVLLIRL